MNDVLAWSLRLARKQTLSMIRDLEPGQWCLQSSAGEHHPAWVVGHLLLADCYLLHLLGVEELRADFPDLLASYGPGAVPTACRGTPLRSGLRDDGSRSAASHSGRRAGQGPAHPRPSPPGARLP